MKEKYNVVMKIIGSSVISFNITYKGYNRDYPMYLCDELTLIEDFVSDKIEEFLDEIKNYPKSKHIIKI